MPVGQNQVMVLSWLKPLLAKLRHASQNADIDSIHSFAAPDLAVSPRQPAGAAVY
ncbi:MAG: hypothetical protein R2911_03200 [Caldilineaceae bacterium]